MKQRPKLYLTVLAVTGLALMYQAAGLQAEERSIGELDRKMVGEKVTVDAEVQNVSAANDTVFFTLKNGSEKITAVTFRENLLLYESLNVEASGKVTIYRGELELVVDSID